MAIQRGEIWKDIKEISMSWSNSLPNVFDLMISSVYQDAISVITRPSRKSFTGILKRKIKYLNELVFSILRKKDLEYKPSTLVLWVAEYSHVNQIFPLVAHFKEQGISYQWVTNKAKVVGKLAQLDEKVLFIPPYYRLDFGLTRKFQTALTQALAASAAPEMLKRSVTETTAKNLRHVVSLMRSNEEIIAKCKPKAVIVGNDLTLEGRVAAYVFKKHALFSCSLQHGDMSSVLHQVHSVDRFYLYGEASLQQVKHTSDTDFVVTGSAFLDSFKKENTSSLIAEQLNLKHSKPYILVTFSGGGDSTSFPHHEQLIDAVFDLEKSVPDGDIVIKLHPKDRMSYYEQANARYPLSTIRVVPYGEKGLPVSILEWISGAAVVITGASTTAVEAMTLGIPVISVDLANEYRQVGFINHGATIHVTEKQQLSSVVGALLNQENDFDNVRAKAEHYAAAYFFKGAGSASERIVRNIFQSIGQTAKI